MCVYVEMLGKAKLVGFSSGGKQSIMRILLS